MANHKTLAILGHLARPRPPVSRAAALTVI
jgi:hypothetical protein